MLGRGPVEFDDYTKIDNGFSNGLSGWINGDFNVNDHVNFDDYTLIDNAFNAQNNGGDEWPHTPTARIRMSRR